jgi:hypothetical protein
MAELVGKFPGVEVDGILTVKEGIMAGAAALLALLLVFFIVHKILERSYIRKTSIFRVKKNKYKSRLGKKNIKY